LLPELPPLSDSLRGAELLDNVAKILNDASEKLVAARAAGAARPRVVPQPLFSSLDESGLRAMIGIFEVATVPEGAVLIEQGTRGAEAYVVARGELEVQRVPHEADASPIRLARLGAGALFGEMALLSRSPRAARVIACRPSVLLVARKEALDEVAAHRPEIGREFAAYCRRRMLDNLVRTSSVLRAVTPEERPALVEMFITRTFEEHETIISQGHASEGLHLIASGEVVVVHKDGEESTVIAELGPGEVVGEMALVLRRPANAHVIASHPTITLHLPRDRFLALIKQHPAILSELYELAVKRDEETSSIVAQEATDIDEVVLL
jgi:cAMP-dependent protein kinase regulator